MTRLSLALLVTSFACVAHGQGSKDERGTQAPPVRESLCERLAGAERERCFEEERAVLQDRARDAQAPPGRRACDELRGPEKELCLKRGGTVKAGTGSTR